MRAEAFLAITLSVCAALAASTACGTSSSSPSGTSPSGDDAGAAGDDATTFPLVTIAPDPQRPGDATKGYDTLVNDPYVPCGIPLTAYSQVFGAPSAAQTVPGRTGKNVDLPYAFTYMKTDAGVELATSNCLTCHAGQLLGKTIVGLGASDADFTTDATTQSQEAEGVGLLLTDSGERAEWRKWADRIEAIAPWSQLDTIGVNPADSFTSVLFAHHDPKTMAWSNTPLMVLPPKIVVPVHTPPWWRMKKKAAMFYVGAGRGDHARIEMTASILCTSSVAESQAIDAKFVDVRAWIETLDAPKYPFPIDSAKAAQGKTVFTRTCAGCHGVDGDYPNRVVSVAEVGTDGMLASGSAEFAAPYVQWFKDSFFGELARFEPAAGYVAPPLDGIWASAPYLHNGSVPTIAALLDSTKRPTYWTRSFDSNDYDPAAVGWKFTVVDHGKSGESSAAARKKLYDTTEPGYSNAGHTFGDALSDDDRAAVVEYLKTL